MDSKKIIPDSTIQEWLDKYGFVGQAGDGRLMLAELLVKAGAGFYNSHTDEAFLNSFDPLKADRTPNKKGARFLCAIFYNHSNKKPEAYFLMHKYRFD